MRYTLLLLAALLIACSGRERRTPGAGAEVYSKLAVAFTEALLGRDYAAAYAMTSGDYQHSTTLEAMRTGFEAVVPPDWQTVGPVTVVRTMEDWPGKGPADIGWAYVGIGGVAYSEGLTVIVAVEGDMPMIRSVEFGRP